MQGGQRLAIVEDEAMIAMMIQEVLIEQGYEVAWIADTLNGAGSMVALDPPDMVLCDIKLLGGDSGLDVAVMLRERDIPCLFISGNCPSAEDAGQVALGCLAKPFPQNRLTHAVSAAFSAIDGQMPADVPPGMTLY
ncbi:response regulator [Sphingobium sp. H39-3-25]|uniref:response regulator n=1 Tax=Sphingobium arseniciresistens TaxID=3030834 RepID=UPI0023B9EBCC|nr:response regulator [Sphingobium arseniciresistens]